MRRRGAQRDERCPAVFYLPCDFNLAAMHERERNSFAMYVQSYSSRHSQGFEDDMMINSPG